MRYDRNRGMFFGSWTGTSVAEYAEANIGDSTGITAVEVTAATFGTGVNGLAGEYIFMFKNGQWEYQSTPLASTALSTTYGITATGTPAENDIIVVLYNPASGGWEAIGKDNDDLSKELNPDTENSKNVLGENTFFHSGYEPEIGVDPYYIDPSRRMYKRILENAMEEKYGEYDLKGYFAEAFFTAANKETRIMTGYCYVREAWFVPESVGGDTTAFGVPVSIYPVGAVVKKNIVYDMKTNEATITEIETDDSGEEEEP